MYGTSSRLRLLLVTSVLLLLLGLLLVLFSLLFFFLFLFPRLTFVSSAFLFTPILLLVSGLLTLALAVVGILLWRRGRREVSRGLRGLGLGLGLAFVLSLLACVAAFHLRGIVANYLPKTNVLAQIKQVSQDEVLKGRWDALQRSYSCCGGGPDGYLDYSGPNGAVSSVPDSCCVSESPGCGRSPFVTPGAAIPPVEQVIHTSGCVGAIKESLHEWALPLLLVCALVALVAALIELLLMLSACCFAGHVKAIKEKKRSMLSLEHGNPGSRQQSPLPPYNPGQQLNRTQLPILESSPSLKQNRLYFQQSPSSTLTKSGNPVREGDAESRYSDYLGSPRQLNSSLSHQPSFASADQEALGRDSRRQRRGNGKRNGGFWSCFGDKEDSLGDNDDYLNHRKEMAYKEEAIDREETLMGVLKNVSVASGDSNEDVPDRTSPSHHKTHSPKKSGGGFSFFGFRSKSREDVLESSDPKPDRVKKEKKAKSMESLNVGKNKDKDGAQRPESDSEQAKVRGFSSFFSRSKEKSRSETHVNREKKKSMETRNHDKSDDDMDNQAGSRGQKLQAPDWSQAGSSSKTQDKQETMNGKSAGNEYKDSSDQTQDRQSPEGVSAMDQKERGSSPCEEISVSGIVVERMAGANTLAGADPRRGNMEQQTAYATLERSRHTEKVELSDAEKKLKAPKWISPQREVMRQSDQQKHSTEQEEPQYASLNKPSITELQTSQKDQHFTQPRKPAYRSTSPESALSSSKVKGHPTYQPNQTRSVRITEQNLKAPSWASVHYRTKSPETEVGKPKYKSDETLTNSRPLPNTDRDSTLSLSPTRLPARKPTTIGSSDDIMAFTNSNKLRMPQFARKTGPTSLPYGIAKSHDHLETNTSQEQEMQPNIPETVAVKPSYRSLSNDSLDHRVRLSGFGVGKLDGSRKESRSSAETQQAQVQPIKRYPRAEKKEIDPERLKAIENEVEMTPTKVSIKVAGQKKPNKLDKVNGDGLGDPVKKSNNHGSEKGGNEKRHSDHNFMKFLKRTGYYGKQKIPGDPENSQKWKGDKVAKVRPGGLSNSSEDNEIITTRKESKKPDRKKYKYSAPEPPTTSNLEEFYTPVYGDRPVRPYRRQKSQPPPETAASKKKKSSASGRKRSSSESSVNSSEESGSSDQQIEILGSPKFFLNRKDGSIMASFESLSPDSKKRGKSRSQSFTLPFGQAEIVQDNLVLARPDQQSLADFYKPVDQHRRQGETSSRSQRARSEPRSQQGTSSLPHARAKSGDRSRQKKITVNDPADAWQILQDLKKQEEQHLYRTTLEVESAVDGGYTVRRSTSGRGLGGRAHVARLQLDADRQKSPPPPAPDSLSPSARRPPRPPPSTPTRHVSVTTLQIKGDKN